MSVWRVIENLRTEVIDGKKMKTIVLYRLRIAEKDVWRTYKKKSNDASDINGAPYESTCWKSF